LALARQGIHGHGGRLEVRCGMWEVADLAAALAVINGLLATVATLATLVEVSEQFQAVVHYREALLLQRFNKRGV